MDSEDKQKLEDIHTAVIGRSNLGIEGLVAKSERHETELKRLDKILVRWGGVAFGLFLLIEAGKTYIHL